MPLGDCWDRINWSDTEAKTLDQEIRAHLTSQPSPYAPIVVEDAHGPHDVEGHIEMHVRREAPRYLARRVGVILDDLRAALNYLAYQLALQDGIDKPETVEFPIFNDTGLYTKNNRVKQLSKEHRDAIEAEQPYNGRNPNLWILHELSRAHRHRVIHPVLATLASTENGIEILGGSGIIEHQDLIKSGPFKDRDVVMTFRCRATTTYMEVNVNPNVTVDVVLDHELATEIPCNVLVRRMGKETLDLIRDFEGRFF